MLLASEFARSANKEKKLNRQNSEWVKKKAEFDAGFESIGKVAKSVLEEN